MSRAERTCPVRDREAVPLAEGDPHELMPHPPAYRGRPRLRLARPALHRPPGQPNRGDHMSVPTESPAGVTAIRPFTVPVTPEAEIEALRARIAATRWPEKETVYDLSQGVQLAAIQALARYW